MKVEIRDKDFQGKAELRELLPIINTLNKLLANIVVYRSQKHKETFWNSEGTSVKKKWLQLDFCVVEKGVSRSDEKLPAEIRVETDPEKCEQYIEEFKREYQKWLLDYECRRAEKQRRNNL